MNKTNALPGKTARRPLSPPAVLPNQSRASNAQNRQCRRGLSSGDNRATAGTLPSRLGGVGDTGTRGQATRCAGSDHTNGRRRMAHETSEEHTSMEGSKRRSVCPRSRTDCKHLDRQSWRENWEWQCAPSAGESERGMCVKYTDIFSSFSSRLPLASPPSPSRLSASELGFARATMPSKSPRPPPPNHSRTSKIKALPLAAHLVHPRLHPRHRRRHIARPHPGAHARRGRTTSEVTQTHPPNPPRQEKNASVTSKTVCIAIARIRAIAIRSLDEGYGAVCFPWITPSQNRKLRSSEFLGIIRWPLTVIVYHHLILQR